jgi:hypothetical protein
VCVLDRGPGRYDRRGGVHGYGKAYSARAARSNSSKSGTCVLS